MLLNIYYSENLDNLTQFQDFFIKNYFFKDGDILNGRLFDVHFYTISHYTENSNSIDVILIDEHLIDELYDNEPLQQKILDEKAILLGLSENFSALSKWSEEINLIRAFHRKDLFEFLYTEITHDILRIKLGKEKLQVFISHAKKDGREVAKLFKEYIDSDVKLDNFFDETDIQSSESWKKSLKDNVENSLFLFIYSDNYAHTIWTQKELIWAKSKRVPIIGVDVLSKEDKRVFPYIGNVKMVKLLHNVKHIEHLCDSTFSFQTAYNMRAIVNALLKEALETYLFKKKTKEFKDDFLILSRPPELFDLCKHEQDVLYPDPPLFYSEKSLLDSCVEDTKLLTPLMLGESSIRAKNIAISVSESSDLKMLGYTIEHLNMLMVELARYLLIQNNTLLYGGDLGYKKEFNFTQLLAELQDSFNYAQNSKKRVINYAVKPFSKNISLKLKNRYKNKIDFQEIGKPCASDNIALVTKNLSLMRKIVTKEMDIKIAIGGKTTGFSGSYPGILEEVYLAIKAGKSTYLIGGFGGMTKKIIELIRGSDVNELKFKYQKSHAKKMGTFINANSTYEKKVKKRYEKKVKKRYKKMYKYLRNNKSKDIFILDNCSSIDEIIRFLVEK